MYIAPFIANVGIQEYSLSVLYTWCNKAKNSAKTLSNVKYFDCWHPRRLLQRSKELCENPIKYQIFRLLASKRNPLLYSTPGASFSWLEKTKTTAWGLYSDLFLRESRIKKSPSCSALVVDHSILYSDMFLRESRMKKNPSCSSQLFYTCYRPKHCC